MSSLSENEKRVRSILQEMNKSDISLEEFYEQLEKEFSNRVPFSKLKKYLEEFYVSISKSKLN